MNGRATTGSFFPIASTRIPRGRVSQILIPDLDVDDLRAARQLAARHRDLKLEMTDAVNAVLAQRYDTNEILTTDQRHFRAITPLSRRFDALRILPADL